MEHTENSPIWPQVDKDMLWGNILLASHIFMGGHGGRVVTLSPPTSDVGVRFPGLPQVGKLVVACHWSAVYSTEPWPTVCTDFLCPSNYPSWYDLYNVERDVKPISSLIPILQWENWQLLVNTQQFSLRNFDPQVCTDFLHHNHYLLLYDLDKMLNPNKENLCGLFGHNRGPPT